MKQLKNFTIKDCTDEIIFEKDMDEKIYKESIDNKRSVLTVYILGGISLFIIFESVINSFILFGLILTLIFFISGICHFEIFKEKIRNIYLISQFEKMTKAFKISDSILKISYDQEYLYVKYLFDNKIKTEMFNLIELGYTEETCVPVILIKNDGLRII